MALMKKDIAWPGPLTVLHKFKSMGAILPLCSAGCEETDIPPIEKSKVIVIGTGIGGAAAAAIAAYYGHDVTIYEKNMAIGGKTHTYQFETSHGLWKLDHGHLLGLGEFGPHGDVLKLVNRSDLIPKYSNFLSWGVKLSFDDMYIHYPPSLLLKPLGLITEMIKVRPSIKDSVGITKMLADIVLMPESVIQSYDNVSFKTYMDRFFTNKIYKSFFSALCIVIGGVAPDTASAGEQIRIYKNSAFNLLRFEYPINGEGIQAIPNSFLKAATDYGAKVVTNSPVEKIIVEDNTARGVIINGERIDADIVISNAGIGETVLKLVGEDKFDYSYAQKIKNLKYGYGGLSLKYALDKKITSYAWFGDVPSDMTPVAEKMDQGIVPDGENEYTPWMGVATSNLDSSLVPEGCQSLCVISGGCNNIDPKNVDWEPWMDAVKKRVEKMFPDIKQHTLFIDEMTPVQIQEFNGGIMGDAVAASQSVDQVGDNRPSIVSPIKNLYNVGADMGKGYLATELASESALRLAEYLKSRI